MVRYGALLLLSACSVEGTVLVLHEVDAAVLDANVPLPPPMDATVEASIDARTPEAEAAAPRAETRGVCRVRGASDGFYESFDAPLDPARWLIADGVLSVAGDTSQRFERANVTVEEGALALRVRRGSAAAIATRDLFGSATYQVQGRFSAAPGVRVALVWQRDDVRDGTLDIATPGMDGSYERVAMRSRDGTGSSENQFAVAPALDDGAEHILRFDRYTTGSPSVRFWVDDVGRWSTSEHLPTMRAGRMWIVAYVQDTAPSALEGAVIRITNTFVTPFGNAGDSCMDGELGGPGLTLP